MNPSLLIALTIIQIVRFRHFLLVPLVGIALNGSVFGATQADFALPAPASTDSTLSLWATNYFVWVAKENPTGIALVGKDGRPITAKISARDWCLGAIEGTVLVETSTAKKTVNFARKGSKLIVDCAKVLSINPVQKPWISGTSRSLFALAKGPYGDGVRGFILVPFRTIAVDPRIIPFGTVIYIPKAKGLEFVDDQGHRIKHDGYFFAGDTGGAIKGNHIDVFCGVAQRCFTTFVLSKSSGTFKASVVKEIAIINQLKSRQR